MTIPIGVMRPKYSTPRIILVLINPRTCHIFIQSLKTGQRTVGITSPNRTRMDPGASAHERSASPYQTAGQTPIKQNIPPTINPKLRSSFLFVVFCIPHLSVGYLHFDDVGRSLRQFRVISLRPYRLDGSQRNTRSPLIYRIQASRMERLTSTKNEGSRNRLLLGIQ